MISAGRIVTVFRKKGRSGEFTKLASEFAPDQFSPVLDQLENEEALIVGMRSGDEWFVITRPYLFLKHMQGRERVRLDAVVGILNNIREHAEGKHHGGTFRLRLRDGATICVKVESGGPYVALWNVFRYLCKMNNPPSNRPLMGRGAAKPTTDDQRPTTPL